MTDIDRLLADDGARWRAAQPAAPDLDPALLTRPDRRRWQPVAAAAAAVVILVGITAGIVATRPGPPAGPPAGAGAEPPLLGTTWQLASYQVPGSAPVPVRVDSTLELSPKGTVSIHACNHIGGPAHVVGSRIGFGSAASTQMLCTGELGTLDQHVLALLAGGAADWSIRDRTLTLTGRDRLVLTYRVRASIYPDLASRTLVAGDRAGGQYRLAVNGAGVPLGLTIETRTAPGDGWGTAYVIAPGPKDCLANHVMAGDRLGGQAFLAAWATPEVARVTVRAKPGAPETTLPFLAVPGSTLRVAGLWTAVFRPSVSPVTFYDRAGAVIAAYPNGPC